MSTNETRGAISHADEIYPYGHRRSFEADHAKSKVTVDEQYPDYHMNDNLAAGIAVILRSEQSRRNAHYYRYRDLFLGTSDERLFTSDGNVVEASLIDLDSRVNDMTVDQAHIAQVMGGKGISAELGHVDQFGEWAAGSKLDHSIRALPKSKRLEDAGFVFADTYGEKDRAKISYKIQIADELKSDSHESSRGSVLKGVRKRAAADVLTENGNAYEIVKMSTFLIHSSQLGGAYIQSINQALELSNDKTTKHLAPSIMNKLGKEIIEPFVTHPEFRSLSPGVLAVSSLYFALHRAKQ